MKPITEKPIKEKIILRRMNGGWEIQNKTTLPERGVVVVLMHVMKQLLRAIYKPEENIYLVDAMREIMLCDDDPWELYGDEPWDFYEELAARMYAKNPEKE